MNYLSVEKLSKSFGDRPLFESISFGVNKGDKVAIVAKNGAGKSTLLDLLTGIEHPDAGRIVYRKGIRIGYLAQTEHLDNSTTVFDAVLQTDTPQAQAIKAYDQALQNPSDTASYEAAFEKMTTSHAWDYEIHVMAILSQLQLKDKHQKVGTLSGGQKKRVALAKLLLSKPDIMLLDEPTNHLDLNMIEWLEDYLSRSATTLIMVTHDRYFLEVICTTILELEDRTMYSYEGNFSYYLEQRAARHEMLRITTAKATNLMRKELNWMRRQPKARGTKQKARVDAFEELKKTASQKMQEDSMEVKVQMHRLGTKIVEVHRLGKQFGERSLIKDFSYVFKRGEKIGIVGENGTGKSTFLQMLTGGEPPSKGKIVVGETVVMGYYHQSGLSFKADQKVIDVIRDIAEYIPLEKGRKMSAAQFLEQFLFPREMHFQPVEKLSGGEKKRLYLMTVLMHNPNFLILDEPTNDLDIFTLSVLENYLIAFKGCLIVVAHDRYFLDKLTDHTFYFKGDGEVKDLLGNYTVYRNYLKEKKEKNDRQQKEKKKKTPPPTTKKRQQLTYKEQRELEALEDEIAALEREQALLAQQLHSREHSSEAANQIAIRLSEIPLVLQQRETRWLTLAEQL